MKEIGRGGKLDHPSLPNPAWGGLLIAFVSFKNAKIQRK